MINNEWIEWISYERDIDGYARLKENAPERIKKQYEEYKKNKNKYKKILEEWNSSIRH